MLAWNYVVALCMVSFLLGFGFCCAAVASKYKCNHEYEKIFEGSNTYANHTIVYRCKKCGKIQKVKVG